MKAMVLQAYGGVDQLVSAEVPTPRPEAGQVLIRIEASAVNPFDLLLRQGFMAKFIPLPLPAVLGGDAAGTIVELGAGVTGFTVGERVVADFPANGHGAHAEYGVVSAGAVARLPGNLSFEQGAALVKAGLTGRQTVEALGVKAGDRVLVSGGLGAVGRAAIQYLQELGAHPVAGVRPERAEEARRLGAEALDITVRPSSPGFSFAISASGAVAGNLIANVRDGGQVASIVPVPEGANPNQRVVIHQLVHRTDAVMLEAVLQAAARGLLVIPIAKVLPLEQLGAAQEAVAAGARGKVVLEH